MDGSSPKLKNASIYECGARFCRKECKIDDFLFYPCFLSLFSLAPLCFLRNAKLAGWELMAFSMPGLQIRQR